VQMCTRAHTYCTYMRMCRKLHNLALCLLRTLLLQAVDRFNNLVVTAYVTPGNARFLLLHDGRNDDNIRAFFSEVYEVYLKASVFMYPVPFEMEQHYSCPGLKRVPLLPELH